MNRNSDQHIQKLLSEARSGSRASMGCLAVIVRERLHPFVLKIRPQVLDALARGRLQVGVILEDFHAEPLVPTNVLCCCFVNCGG